MVDSEWVRVAEGRGVGCFGIRVFSFFELVLFLVSRFMLGF